MAIDVERERVAFPIQDDPMRTFGDPRTASRPAGLVGDPAPLGLAALGLTLMVFSMFNAGLLARSGEPVVLGMALAYGGIAQLLAGMWELRRGNSFGALTFASYGAFWISYWLLEQFFVKGIPAGERGSALGLYFIAWAIFTALLWIASTRTTAVVSVMLLALAVSFLLLGIGDAGAHGELAKIGGWFGLAATVAALYGAFAGAINGTYARTLLPLVPIGRRHTTG
jgi:succinate-acetate transporter protein